ncbi:DUF5011 domain-containing protein [bacterium]|nr:DUF5011 domain-containing protein [bacterium]
MNKNAKVSLIVILSIYVISVLFILLMPNISLKGKNHITIKLEEKYKEPGYQATFLLQDKKNQVKVESNLNNKKVGTYKITYTLKNGKLKTKATRTIDVVDQEKPVITLSGNSYACPSKDYIEEGFQAIDNYDGDITSNVIITKQNDSILYSVKDSSGNSQKVTRKIIKGDIEAPKLVLNGEESIVLNVGDAYNELGVTVTDNCDQDIQNKVAIESNVNTNVAGQYTVSYTATDDSENKTTITRTVTVVNPYNSPNLNGVGKVIYLTFDDGPSSTITPSLLQILKEENVKATFFVINHSDSLNYLIKQEYDEGHTVALHSDTHEYSYVYSSVDNYFNDLTSIQNKVSGIIGIKPNIIRFPGGSSNTVSRKYSPGIMSILTKEVLNRGFIYFDWNVSSEDAGGARTASQVYNNVVNNLVYKNNVVLLHDFESNYKTLNAIRDIIQYGKSHGYIFKAITQDTYPTRHHVNN